MFDFGFVEWVGCYLVLLCTWHNGDCGSGLGWLDGLHLAVCFV